MVFIREKKKDLATDTGKYPGEEEDRDCSDGCKPQNVRNSQQPKEARKKHRTILMYSLQKESSPVGFRLLATRLMKRQIFVVFGLTVCVTLLW